MRPPIPGPDVESTGSVPIAHDERDDPAHPTDGAAVEDAGASLPAVAPQAPLDVRLLDTIGELLAARPRWSERPPSRAETWEYSTSGDWTTEEKSVKRLLHNLSVLIAFVVTYPIDWWSQAAKEKPVVLVLTAAVLLVLHQVL